MCATQRLLLYVCSGMEYSVARVACDVEVVMALLERCRVGWNKTVSSSEAPQLEGPAPPTWHELPLHKRLDMLVRSASREKTQTVTPVTKACMEQILSTLLIRLANPVTLRDATGSDLTAPGAWVQSTIGAELLGDTTGTSACFLASTLPVTPFTPGPAGCASCVCVCVCVCRSTCNTFWQRG